MVSALFQSKLGPEGALDGAKVELSLKYKLRPFSGFIFQSQNNAKDIFANDLLSTNVC